MASLITQTSIATDPGVLQAPSLIQAVIRSAWRRRLRMLSIEQLGFALNLVFPGVFAMLLLGTQILDSYWLVLLCAAAGVIAIVRVRRRVLSHYAVAQIVDERFQLRDSLSTAWYLLSDSTKYDKDPALFQISKAEEIARGVQAEELFPFSGRRIWALAGGMACVVVAVFAVRYLVTDSLSLRPSILPLHFSTLNEGITELMLPAKTRDLKADVRDRPNVHGRTEEQSGLQSETGKNPGRFGGQEEDSTAGSKAEGGHGGADVNSERFDGTQEHSSGLTDKMKDALSSLMTKLGASPTAAQHSTQREAQESSDGLAEDQRTGQNGQTKNGMGQSRESQHPKGDSSSAAREQVQTTENSSRAGTDSDEGPQGKNSDSQSGAGRQDGDKTLTDAEQLKAMGRIAEIIGKRSANVSGEMTVEKSSGQQLQTQYSHQVSRHRDLGGEINHDEFPAEYRDYVREYMNEVHKQAQAKR